MELSVTHSLTCSTVCSRAFLLKPRGAGFHCERKTVLEFWGHVSLIAGMDVVSWWKQGFPGTVPVLKLKVPCARNLLSSRQTGALGDPNIFGQYSWFPVWLRAPTDLLFSQLNLLKPYLQVWFWITSFFVFQTSLITNHQGSCKNTLPGCTPGDSQPGVWGGSWESINSPKYSGEFWEAMVNPFSGVIQGSPVQ